MLDITSSVCIWARLLDEEYVRVVKVHLGSWVTNILKEFIKLDTDKQ